MVKSTENLTVIFREEPLKKPRKICSHTKSDKIPCPPITRVSITSDWIYDSVTVEDIQSSLPFPTSNLRPYKGRFTFDVAFEHKEVLLQVIQQGVLVKNCSINFTLFIAQPKAFCKWGSFFSPYLQEASQQSRFVCQLSRWS